MWRKLLGIGFCFMLLACSSSFLDKGRSFHTQPVTWAQVPGWQRDNFLEVLPAVLNSCTKAPQKMIRFCFYYIVNYHYIFL